MGAPGPDSRTGERTAPEGRRKIAQDDPEHREGAVLGEYPKIISRPVGALRNAGETKNTSVLGTKVQNDSCGRIPYDFAGKQMLRIFSNRLNLPEAFLLALAMIYFQSLLAFGQQCPQSSKDGPSIPSVVRTLEGKLVFHDDIRQWFELKLDQPQCNQPSIQLVRGERDWKQLEILRGCRIRSKGAIDFSPTGYYSLDTYQ